MFFRRKNQAPSPASPQGGKPAAPTDRTLLGPGWQFKGRVYGKGHVVVQCDLEGELDLQGTVALAPEGSIKGSMRSEEVRMGGRFDGRLEGSRLVVLEETAQLEGEVAAPRIEMASGARLNGQVDMESARQSTRRTKP